MGEEEEIMYFSDIVLKVGREKERADHDEGRGDEDGEGGGEERAGEEDGDSSG